MHGLDWYDYGARWYDGMRFLTQDPHAGDYVSVSPYAYCVNNPINAIDPDGKRIRTLLYEDNKFSKYYESSVDFRSAMFRFAKTSFGKQLFADFPPKNSFFFGVKGNGKYSDFNLNIYECSFSNPEEKTAFFRDVNAQTQLKEGECGKPIFNVLIDVERDSEKLLETVCHEFAGHLYKYNKILDAFKKTGKFDEARKVWNAFPQEKDHKEMHDIKFQDINIYQKMMIELFHKKTYKNKIH